MENQNNNSNANQRGSGESLRKDFAPRSSHPLDRVVDRPTGAVLAMQTGLFNHGQDRALKSGTTEPRPEDIKSLEAHARAMARQTYRDKYMPGQNVHDKMIEHEYQKLLKDRSAAEDIVQHLAANLRDAEQNLAHTSKAGARPAIHPLLSTAAILAITITCAPSLHDIVFEGLDDLLAWFLSFLCGAFIGAFITWAILGGQRSGWKWLGMVAGVAIGIGLGLLRISAATDLNEVLFGIALTIVEVGVVVLLEWFAIGLRKEEERWVALHDAESKAAAERDNALNELSRQKATLTELNAAIISKIDYVEDRYLRNLTVAELETVAVEAVLDGYVAGIAENIGRIRGVKRKQR